MLMRDRLILINLIMYYKQIFSISINVIKLKKNEMLLIVLVVDK
jgi:hypothetical protein